MRFIKKVTAVMLLLFVVSGSYAPVFASNVNEKQGAENYIKQTTTVKDGALNVTNGVVRDSVSLTSNATYNQALILSDGATVVYYNKANTSSIYAAAQKAEANSNVGDKVNDITDGLGIEANTSAAATMLGGFKPILELVIGIIVVAITLGMTLFTSMDMAYIAFPTFRNKAETAKQGGGQGAGAFGSAMTKQSSGGETKFRWITDEAVYAVEAGAMGSGQSPWMIYLKKRVAAYIFLSIVLVVLLTGNITIITSIAVNLVNGIINILADLAS